MTMKLKKRLPRNFNQPGIANTRQGRHNI